ncbi:amino acid/amide ABC transporter membrane protein 2, HAAT family [Desulfonispora thiosulfatigenes DSM 11270]|uniref:Amino acid/amide ABC transporter membrane protein 2, HAAT family n=1 Tax=Desulfonispora thiosulfatigenes DSM 11270 TaxID=656914 RepID=A0A1W1VED3_DESTI|nr:branched-chain amino acid ABC transporter permease [Desulfonispora thiosulfatigenes]SMB91685.1 amino acid/amide ABC transporter membrane protein 2, HAAT family [Desulfonispora thiosulfatigenes DSM 11270]
MNIKMKHIISITLMEIVAYVLLLSIIVVEDYLISAFLVLATTIGFSMFKKKQANSYEKIKNLFEDNKIFSYIVLFILVCTFPILQAHNPYWIQVAIMVCLYIMMSLGLNVMVGNTGLTCLGYAAFYAIGAYTYGILASRFGLSFWLCIPISALFVMAFGFLLGLPALRVKGHYLALVTIAFGLVVYQLTINLENLTGGANGLMNIPAPSIGGYSFNSPLNLGFINLPFHANYFYLSLVFVAIAILVVNRLSHSLTGLTLNAIREDQLAAQCYGVDLTKNKLWAFAFGAIFGGVAGTIYAGMVGFIAPENFTYHHSILILSMILLGGIDSIPGVILGAIILTIVPEKFRAFADYRMMFYGLTIVLILLFKNDGLIPARTRKFTSKWKSRPQGQKNHLTIYKVGK